MGEICELSVTERLQSVRRSGGYDPGDLLSARVKDADGIEHPAEFEVEAFCGGGFAGQVYRARCVAGESGSLAVGQCYALKFFSPRSGFRRLFRDILYRLCFISPFAYQYNEDSVRAGLFLTKLLQIACRVVLGTDRPINEFYGTFWDAHVGAYAEVNEWVQGGVTEPSVDPDILVRRAYNRKVRRAIREGTGSEAELQLPPSEMAAKKRFMAFLCRLCADLGLDDLARQVFWWTGASQPNVLTRRDGSAPPGQPDFVWVDRRPGLPGLILSLGDVALLARAIRRGSIPPFDRVNFRTLRAWPKAPDRQEWVALVDRMAEADRRYRRTQVDPWGHHVRLVTDRSLRRDLAAGFIAYWQRTGRVDAETRAALESRPLLFALHGALSILPLVGRRMQQWAGSAAYRERVRRLLRDAAYRWEYFDDARAGTVKVWLADGRATERRAARCLDSFPRYLADRLLCGWLPAAWQRFFTDWAYQKECWRRFFTSPFRYVFAADYRREVNTNWVAQRTAEDAKRGFISHAEAEEFVRVAGDKTIQHYISGLMVVAACQPVSELTFLLLAALGVHHYVVNPRVLPQLGWWFAPIAFVILGISPAGILRFLYCLVMGATHRDVPYGTATVMAPIRAVGDLSFAAQMAKTHPGFSRYLLTATTCRLAEHVPVFGERGGLLSVWVVTVALSWPASLKTWWIARAQRAAIRRKGDPHKV
ncbi:MAG: hypothetical protein HY321_00600 [Armatimonadetes bacterium]|nr:hypothetical protein [Armatimonadota bacterium]